MSNYDLELVQILFRHGDRTPEKSEDYPNDRYKSFDYAPFGHAQLTNKGKRRAYKLGEVLKNRYGTFLGQYKPENVFAYSTFYDRCKTSLQLVLAGLFPPTAELVWNENLLWMPITFEYNSYDNEMFYHHSRDPRLSDFMEQAYQSCEIKTKKEKFEKILEYIVNETGCDRRFDVMYKIYRNIQSKMGFGLPMPDWCDEKLLEDLKEAYQIKYDVFLYNDELKKLIVGPFLKKAIENINENNNKKKDVRVYLYCTHGLTIHAFLRAHNINHIRMLEYGATVVLEKLRGKDDEQYIRLLFWSGEGEQFETLELKDCNEIFLLEKYLEIVNPLLPTDPE